MITLLSRTLMFATILFLYSCGGGSGGDGADGGMVMPTSNGTSSPAAALEGGWVEAECLVDAEEPNRSSRSEYEFRDGQFTQRFVDYLNDSSCNTDLTLTVTVQGTFTVSGETTVVSEGEAFHLDITFTEAMASASQSTIDALEANGETLEATLAESGITDASNIPLDLLFPSNTVFSIFRADGDTISIGTDLGSGSGLSPEDRFSELGTVLNRTGAAPVGPTDGPTDDTPPQGDGPITTLPMNAQTGIPTTGSGECTFVLDDDISSPTRLVNTDADCDYRLMGWVEIRSDLVIEPGVGIRADADARIVVDGGRIVADGTASSPIVMDGNAHTAGYWQGIDIQRGRESTFNHFHLVDAGQVCPIIFCPDVGFEIDEVRISITNSSVSNSFVLGMSISEDTELVAFSNNRFFNNQEAGLAIHPELVPMLDTDSNYSGGAFPNTIPMVQVSSGEHSRGIVYRWKNLEAPYFIGGFFTPEGGRWVVDPGVEIVMDEQAWIVVEGNAVVEMNGTPSQPITIRGRQSSPGYWDGIRFRDSPWEDNQFVNVNILDFGNTENLLSTRAAIDMNDSALRLENVTIGNGVGNGILCDEPTSFSEGSFISLTNVDITGISGVRIDADCRIF